MQLAPGWINKSLSNIGWPIEYTTTNNNADKQCWRCPCTQNHTRKDPLDLIRTQQLWEPVYGIIRCCEVFSANIMNHFNSLAGNLSLISQLFKRPHHVPKPHITLHHVRSCHITSCHILTINHITSSLAALICGL